MPTAREEEILNELALLQEDLYSSEIPKDFSEQIFKQLRNVEGLSEYLRLTMQADIKRYFTVGSDKERDMLRGHYTFASYLRGGLIEKKDTKTETKVVRRANGTVRKKKVQ
jgi:hypothetical protein